MNLSLNQSLYDQLNLELLKEKVSSILALSW